MAKKEKVSDSYPSNNLGDLSLRISDHITAMLAYWDKDLVCRYANSAYAEWFGRTKEEMINKIRIDELLGPLYEKNLPHIQAVLKGNKQLFERDIPIPGGGGVRHSLASYFPDINNGEVVGFFAHVADVSYLKRLEREVAAAKRETLGKIIETEETEKRHLVEILRESISQRLAAGKMLVDAEERKGKNSGINENVGESIREIIEELNLLCQELVPTELEMFGLVEALDAYLAQLADLYHKNIEFAFTGSGIESIRLKDKYSIYRIIQNTLKLALDDVDIKRIEVCMQFNERNVRILFITGAKIALDKNSKQYHAIASRIDHFAGQFSEYSSESNYFLEIEFTVNEEENFR